jgi:UDP-N-acetylmuramoylalanine--D-glutamate ligase
MNDAPFKGKRVLVIGLGRFGGGVGVTEWLVHQGAIVTVTDLADEQALASSVKSLRDLPITWHLGRHNDADLEQCDLIILNPAVNKAKSPFFQKALAARVPWTTEMNLFFERCRGRTIGITGTAGKSTTCALLDSMLRQAEGEANVGYRKAWLGGNIGRSLLSELPNIAADDVVVLELSSFQLDDMANIRQSPHIGLITNISDNHLDRHETMAEYLDAKLNVFRYQKTDEIALVDAADSILRSAVADVVTNQQLVTFEIRDRSLHVEFPGREISELDLSSVLDALQIPGAHNRRNVFAAACIARLLNLTVDQISDGVGQFKGLEHRLEFVAERHGARYFNDSKSTTPAATILALDAFEDPVVVIVGGSDKGAAYDQFATALCDRAKAVVCVGSTQNAIAAAIHRAQAVQPSIPAVSLHLADSFDDAVGLADRLADPGDVVLLSPGHASYDMFVNYEQRGHRFKQIVLRPRD